MSSLLLLAIHFARHIQLWLGTLRFFNQIVLTRTLARHLNAPRTLLSRYPSFRSQATRSRRLRTDVVAIYIAANNLQDYTIGCYLPLIDTLFRIVNLHFLLHFLVIFHLSLPFSLSYYILRFFRIFDDGPLVWINFASRYRYSFRYYVPCLKYPPFDRLFTSIRFYFGTNLALFAFVADFENFGKVYL